MEYAGIGGFLVLVLNVWAIVSIVGSGASTGSKVLWTLLVLVLPIIGFIAWLIAGPKSTKGIACPSSNDLEHERLIGLGGSGSLQFHVMPRSVGAASGVSGLSGF